uniref:Crinkler effector protein N-terminal domain-containing protein n=1 Tax=Globisporangium ultimum (strain ATCC 200006 / CBS 805.95 / DAOM BR144) TaxID=431595 RepID=K3WCC5_GLOUD
METLSCMLVGTERDEFCIDIGMSETVAHLKDAVKKNKELDFPASNLHLYMAKRNNKWL